MENSQPARRGRPPLQDGQDSSNGPQTKRQRMRLAQRTYRARKQESQESKRLRADELSRALDDALATYSNLHQRILGSLQARDSPDIRLHLNDALTSMAAIACSTNKAIALPPVVEDSSSTSPQEPRSSVPPQESESSLFPQEPEEMTRRPFATSGTSDPNGERSSHFGSAAPDQSVARTTIAIRTTAHSPAPVSARVVRACFERAVSILSSPTKYDQKTPTMAIPLQLLGEETIMVDSLRALSLFQASVADYQYPSHSASRPPHLYRAVEGGMRTMPRAPAPFVQRIVRGRTRTIIDTSFAPLRGEWLEAADVEEYLEERGICLRNAISSSRTPATDIVLQAPVPEVEKHPSGLVLPGAVGGRAASLVDSPPTQPGSIEPLPAAFVSADFHGHEPADYSVFGVSEPGSRLPHASVSSHSATERWALTTAVQSALPLDFDHQTPVAANISRITVDLDKLVHLLAENAMCLGPIPGIRKEAVDSSIRQSIVPEPVG